MAGAGGFINISQCAKKVDFVGTFTTGNLEVAIENGRLAILNDGDSMKFIEQVEHRTFSGAEANRRGTTVLFVGHKVYAIVNHDRFNLAPEVVDAYISMVKDLMDRHYLDVTRYASSTFLRLRLDDAMARRDVAPPLFANAAEARAHLMAT